MAIDIRLDVLLPRHQKYLRLRRDVGPGAMECLITLWIAVAQQAPSGLLAGWSLEDLEDAAGWQGKPGQLAAALIERGWVDQTESGFAVHDWEEHQPFIVGTEERAQRNRKAAKERWRKRSLSSSSDATSMHDACTTHATRMHDASEMQCETDAPLPLPIPKPKTSPTNTASAPSRKSKKASGNGKGDPDHAYFSRWFCYSFRSITGSPYAYSKKSAGIIKRLIDSVGLEETVRRACAYLSLPEAKRFPQGAPTLEGLAAMVNQLAGRCTPEIEDRCADLGLLPADYETALLDFRPWESPEVDQP